MSVESDLTDLIYRRYELVTGKAAFAMVELVNSDKNTPRDTGQLGAGVINSQVRRIGGLLVADISSNSTSGGFDYPDFIDKVARIAPTKRKFLHFFVHGHEVFSKGFDNKHRGWWKKVISDTNWTKALGKAK